MSGTAFTHGVETQMIEGVSVQVTSAAKTVADCFRFRNSVGLDVAIEALRAYTKERAGTIDALYLAARASRISSVIQPCILKRFLMTRQTPPRISPRPFVQNC